MIIQTNDLIENILTAGLIRMQVLQFKRLTLTFRIHVTWDNVMIASIRFPFNLLFWFLFIFIFKSKECQHCAIQLNAFASHKNTKYLVINLELFGWIVINVFSKCKNFQQAICGFLKFIAHVIELTVWICLLLFIVINRNSENGAECLISCFCHTW